MDSLTTAYLVCMLIGSIGSFAGAFVGNKVSPTESSIPVQPISQVASAQTPEQSLAPSPQNIVQTQPSVVSASV